jgi:predicted deacylase
VVIVGVHGNEKGPQLEWDWLKSIRIMQGKLTLVLANPTACEQNTRFININLNRRFGLNRDEYPEDAITRQIERVLDSSDALLDLHMYNESMDCPFAISGVASNSVAAVLPAHYIVNIPDSVDGGGADDYMAKQGKVGICFETGSVDRPDKYSDTIRQGVMAFLAHYGLVPSVRSESGHPIVLVKQATKMIKSGNLKFSKNYASFDAIRRGEIICTDDGVPFAAEEEGYILFPRPNNPVGTEAFYLLTHT